MGKMTIIKAGAALYVLSLLMFALAALTAGDTVGALVLLGAGTLVGSIVVLICGVVGGEV